MAGVSLLSVSGTAIAPNGDPLGAAHIFWTLTPGESSSPQAMTELAEGTSASDGSFSLSVPTTAAVSYEVRNHLNTMLSAYKEDSATAGEAGLFAVPFKDLGGGMLVTVLTPSVTIPTLSIPLTARPATTTANLNTPCPDNLCYASCQVSCPPAPTCEAPSSGTSSQSDAYTVVDDLHAGADMTATFSDTLTASNEVSFGASGDGENWTAEGYVTLDDNKGTSNFATETGPWGTTMAAKMHYQENTVTFNCTYQGTDYGITPTADELGIGPGVDTSSHDGFSNYRVNNNQTQMDDFGVGTGASKTTGTTMTYGGAASVWGFNVSTKSDYSQDFSYSWSAGHSYPEYGPAQQYPYHVWADTGNLTSSQTGYAYTGNVELSGSGAFQSTVSYSRPTYTTTPASCTSDSFSFATTSPIMTLDTIWKPPTHAYSGNLPITASGGSSCAGPVEAGSITLNVNPGVGPSGLPTTCGSFSGSYSVSGGTVQINALGTGCTVNGVPTGLLQLTGSGSFTPTSSPVYSANWNIQFSIQ